GTAPASAARAALRQRSNGTTRGLDDRDPVRSIRSKARMNRARAPRFAASHPSTSRIATSSKEDSVVMRHRSPRMRTASPGRSCTCDIGAVQVHALFLAKSGRKLANQDVNVDKSGMPWTSAGCGFLDFIALAQLRDSRTEMRFGCVPECDDERVPLERLLHDAALDSLAAAVNEAHFAQSTLPSRVDVLLDDRLDVAWRERVKIKAVFDR